MKGSVRKRRNSWSYSFDLGFVEGKEKVDIEQRRMLKMA